MTTPLIKETFEKAEGVFQLMPVFVPRLFGEAGRRLRLHPDDYYAMGMNRGSLKERWFSSVINCNNGPHTEPDEGLSYVLPLDRNEDEKFTLRDAIAELGAVAIGDEFLEKYGTWPMYSKFFDYKGPLFHHLHLDSESAAKVDRIGKPEGYYFPPQLNNYMGDFPHTYFGFDPDTTKEAVKERLSQYRATDNKITELSRAYRIELGTGWYTPPGVVHAPGSVLTYEPQWNSDVNSVYENVTAGELYDHEFLVENCPEDKKRDMDYVVDLMDWDANVDPHYKKTFFRPPIDCPQADENYSEKWILYGNDYIGAKELTIQPGCIVTVTDPVAFGCIMIQGHGKFGVYDAESAVMLRYGQASADEYFVTETAAKKGVVIENKSQCEPMVILKHFGPNHPDMP